LRSWPARTHREKLGQAFTPDAELVDITRRCGAALGIDLFGVTVVQSAGTRYVVDMTSIPGFKGVPGAARRLAEYIYAATERALNGAPLLSSVPTPVRDEPAVRLPVVRAPPPPARRTLSAEQALRPRVAMYSQGMMGFGHIRRNASIAQALRGSALQPSIVLIAEAWQAGALPMPLGVDCVTTGVYGDPTAYATVREHDLPDYAAAKVRSTGYPDHRPRLELAEAQTAALLASLPPGKVALCVVGGGHDGGALAEAFVEADFPPDTTGVIVTGPLMPWETRQRLHRAAQRRTRFELLEF